MSIRQENRRSAAHQEHYQLVEMIEKRDLAGFQDLMRKHIERSKEKCIDALLEHQRNHNL